MLLGIFKHFQHHYAKTPHTIALQHAIKFGNHEDPCPATFLQVIQLLPDAYQKYIHAAQKDIKSGLCERIVDIIMRLSSPPDSQEVAFGRGLGACVSETMDR